MRREGDKQKERRAGATSAWSLANLYTMSCPARVAFAVVVAFAVEVAFGVGVGVVFGLTPIPWSASTANQQTWAKLTLERRCLEFETRWAAIAER